MARNEKPQPYLEIAEHGVSEAMMYQEEQWLSDCLGKKTPRLSVQRRILDSLRIIQDLDDGWAQESASMFKVCSRALFTVAVTDDLYRLWRELVAK